MNYYKTNDPAVLAAWETERAEHKALQAKIDTFAARFGGRGLMYTEPACFAGIIFKAPLGRDQWTAPDQYGLQRPRAKPLKGASPETKAALKTLNAEWQEHYPTGTVDSDPFYQSLGCNSSMDFIFGGLTLFVHDGWVYLKCGIKMPQLTEILGSEFDAARAAHRA